MATGLSITKTRASILIRFRVAVGAYDYSVGPIPGFHSTAPGSVDVPRYGNQVDVNLRPYYYEVTFTESGLPSGATWGVWTGGFNFTTTSTSLILYATKWNVSLPAPRPPRVSALGRPEDRPRPFGTGGGSRNLHTAAPTRHTIYRNPARTRGFPPS